jgi:hypothetical protein
MRAYDVGRTICAGAASVAVAMVAMPFAEASCDDPSDPSPLAATSLVGSILQPVGAHPILGRSLVPAGSTASVRETADLSLVRNIPVHGRIESTPNLVRLASGAFAAFIVQQNAIVSRLDPEHLHGEFQGWPVDLSSGDCVGDTITSAAAVHLWTLATASFQGRFDEDIVYVATRYCSETANRIYALSANTGVVHWIFNPTGSENMDAAFADPFLDIENDVLYVATDNSQLGQDSLFAINVLTGNKIWSANHGRLWTAPVLRGDRLYVVDVFGRLKALDAADGSEIWEFEIGVPVSTNIFVEFRAPYDGYVAVVDFSGQVWMVRDDGAQPTALWTASLPGGAEATSRVAMDPQNGKLYVGASDGRLYQLSIDDGSVEASRVVGTAGEEGEEIAVGVPTMVFEDPDHTGRSDTLRLIVGAASGDVAKFCIPWAVEAP